MYKIQRDEKRPDHKPCVSPSVNLSYISTQWINAERYPKHVLSKINVNIRYDL